MGPRRSHVTGGRRETADAGHVPCPVCDHGPRVLVAIAHPTLRRLTRQLLAQEHGCWSAHEVSSGETLAVALARTEPELLVVDSRDFPACCLQAVDTFDLRRVVVVGPEPMPAYRQAALGGQAGGWVARDAIADDLSREMRRALGCQHAPCPRHIPVAGLEAAIGAGTRPAGTP